MKKYGKAFLALTLGLAMAGCSKAPTNVTPANPKVVAPVVSPVNNTLNPSTNDPNYCPPPVVPPLVAPLPLCNFLAFNAIFLFPHFNEDDELRRVRVDSKLFLYDDILKDNYALPGAGERVFNPQYYNGGKIVFDDGCRIFAYDLTSECLLSLDDVNGSVAERVSRPSIDWAGDRMVFIANLHRNEGDVEAGRAFLWQCVPCASVCDLTKVNAVGSMHDGITWIRISADGHWAVFTTGDGQLYRYNIDFPSVCMIADARTIGGVNNRDELFITHPTISATGRQIAFAAVTEDEHGDVKESQIWRYDCVACCLDPMPFANLALNNTWATDPKFECYDEENIYYEAFTPSHELTDLGLKIGEEAKDHVHLVQGGYRVLKYNWLTESVRTLTIVNNVGGDTNTFISDPLGFDEAPSILDAIPTEEN